MGITSARAGYYLSYALPSLGEIRGVATVKVNLEAAEQEWRDLPGEAVMLDEHQVVILASDLPGEAVMLDEHQVVILAAADFEQPGTPVGQDLSYRPYLRDALASGRGAFYDQGQVRLI